MAVYKLEFELRIHGFYDNDNPVRATVVKYKKRPPNKKCGDELHYKMDSSMGFTWLIGEVWHETEFSNEEIYDYLPDFKEYANDVVNNMVKNVNAELKIFKHTEEK